MVFLVGGVGQSGELRYGLLQLALLLVWLAVRCAAHLDIVRLRGQVSFDPRHAASVQCCLQAFVVPIGNNLPHLCSNLEVRFSFFLLYTSPPDTL